MTDSPVKITVTLAPGDNAALEAIAQQAHTSKNEVMRKALHLYEVAKEATEAGDILVIADASGKPKKQLIGL